MPIGVTVTLRETEMEFLTAVNIALLGQRLPGGVGRRRRTGNILGSEQIIFPEINLDKIDKVKG